MSTPHPTRWLEDAEAPFGADARGALCLLAARGPTVAERARMLAQLEAVIADAPAPASARPRSAGGGSRWGWVVGACLALLLAAGPLMRRPSPSSRPTRASAPSHTIAPVVAPPAPRAPAATVAPALPEVAPAHNRDQRSVRRRVRAPAQAAQSLPEVRVPTEELTLLTPARQLLAVDPRRALALTEEHARLFPRGAFREERAFLRIDALLRVGQRDAAEREARAFLLAYPGSTYQESVIQLLDVTR